MNRAFKYRIYPTDEQKMQIAKTIGCCRLMYNQLLDDCNKQLEQTGKVQVKYYTEIKKNYDFMTEVSASALNHSRNVLEEAWQRYFKKLDRNTKQFVTILIVNRHIFTVYNHKNRQSSTCRRHTNFENQTDFFFINGIYR